MSSENDYRVAVEIGGGETLALTCPVCRHDRFIGKAFVVPAMVGSKGAGVAGSHGMQVQCARCSFIQPFGERVRLRWEG